MKKIAYTRVSSPQQRFMVNMERLLKKYYIDIRSENIKRGIAAKKLNKK